MLVGLPLLAGLRSAGAFGNKIAPDAAFKALQEDNVVLVDIRWAGVSNESYLACRLFVLAARQQ